MIPPYKGVRMVEYHDRIALRPIEWKREFVGLCKINTKDSDFEPWEGMNPAIVAVLGKSDVWIILQWERFENGREGDLAHDVLLGVVRLVGPAVLREVYALGDVGVSYFYALEQNPGRDGFHVHALWCDCKSKSRRAIWQTWFNRYGRARIEPVNNRDDVADYCAKYVTKEGAW
jgi:hypothetical protein